MIYLLHYIHLFITLYTSQLVILIALKFRDTKFCETLKFMSFYFECRIIKLRIMKSLLHLLKSD